MIIGNCVAEYFGSFRRLEMDYSQLGLACVTGATGAGKSSILDLPYWIVLGNTSKDGNSDDVRSWFADGPTTGTAPVTLDSGEQIQITRIRGNAKQNDLYWTTAADPETKRRGKDITDTQKRLVELMGVDAELFLTGSYLHQFSRADTFFFAKAKERRETMEKIADLSFAVKMAERMSEARKEAKKALEAKEAELSRVTGRLEEIHRNVGSLEASAVSWEERHAGKLTSLREKSSSFEADNAARVGKILEQLEELDKITVSPKEFDARLAQVRAQLSALNQVKKDHGTESAKLYDIKGKLSSATAERDRHSKGKAAVCPQCLGPTDNPNRAKYVAELSSGIADLSAALEKQKAVVARLDEALSSEDKLRKAYDTVNAEKTSNDRLLDKFEGLQKDALVLRAAKNSYAEQIKELAKEENPFTEKVADAKASEELAVKRSREACADVESIRARVSSLTWLYDKSFELRGALMAKSVRQINEATNKYLERYFDAKLRVKFSLKDSDKLEVEINNEGYSSPFKQLSGGERRMLTLAFSISLMKAAQNKAGIAFPLIMLDEALNGLDDGLKVKAFGLLQELEADHSTILLVEHCEEMKNLFDNRFIVTNTGHSEITAVE